MIQPIAVGPTVIDAIAAEVDRRPDAPALIFDGECLTYEQVWVRAAGVAAALVDTGFIGGTAVGLLCERSFELVIGLLGILRAGGTYVPLEPTYPAKRLQSMIDDFAPAAIITTSRFALQAQQLTGVPVLKIDTLPTLTPRQDPRLLANSPAYIMYTSGSTGQPKGVVIEHQTLLNRLEWMQRRFSATYTDSILHKTPFSFDVSVWELIWPLMCGAKMIIARPGGHVDAAYLNDLIVAEQVTIAHFVPSMLRSFCERAAVTSCRSLRAVICSGEVLPASLASLAQAVTGADVYNLYGPTEATIDVTWWKFRGDEQVAIPIGKPIDNVEVIVLDPMDRPCAPGVVGEIVIAGNALARGYLNLPDLTAERFPTLIVDGLPTRVYRTGDLGFKRDDGAFEFVGRLDSQVKIRGYRIELGDVERAFLAQDNVSQVVVLPVERGTSTSLVAYVVPSAPVDDVAWFARSLREGVRELVPDFMVPAAIRPIDGLPVTPHGKVDLIALRGAEDSVLMKPSSAPSENTATTKETITSTESALIAIWEDILQLRGLTPASDFFELGGDSLRAAALAGELGRRIASSGKWNADLDLEVALFQWPTVRELAAAIDRGDIGR